MYDEPRFLPAGDRALIMELGDAIEEKCNNAIRSVVEAVEAQNIEGIEDATPRLERPREHIPAGSVWIASKQTGIYPIESPGGWQLIGLTPLKLYDPNREPPILPSVGEHIRFKPITKEEFDAIKVKAVSYTHLT